MMTLPDAEGSLAGRYLFAQSYTTNGLVEVQNQAVAGMEEGILHWTYDHVGNPTKLLYQGQFTGTINIVNEATFTPFGEVQTRLLGNSDRYAYQGFEYEEGTRRLTRATFDRQASLDAVADARYTYDDAGNILSIADVPEDLPANHELQCFQYDHQRRLVEAWAQSDTDQCATSPSIGVLGGPAPYWHSYQHDATGNRTSETLRAPGETTVERAYTYPDAGQSQPHTLQQVTATDQAESMSFDYDQAGNTTTRQVDGQSQTLTWDTEGHLAQVEDEDGDAVRMVYDADGNRLIRDDGDTVTAYLPQTELTWDRTNDTLDGTRYFTHAGEVVAICTGQDVADWTWMGTDQHGTTTHSVNAFTGVEQVRRQDPYGNPRGPQPQTWPGQQSFVGGIEDATGLIHIGARSYDPVIGRFISVDPLLTLGDDQKINGYAYARNNPITLSDPTGLCAPDAYSFCPNYPVENQPVANGGKGNSQKSNSGEPVDICSIINCEETCRILGTCSTDYEEYCDAVCRLERRIDSERNRRAERERLRAENERAWEAWRRKTEIRQHWADTCSEYPPAGTFKGDSCARFHKRGDMDEVCWQAGPNEWQTKCRMVPVLPPAPTTGPPPSEWEAPPSPSPGPTPYIAFSVCPVVCVTLTMDSTGSYLGLGAVGAGGYLSAGSGANSVGAEYQSSISGQACGAVYVGVCAQGGPTSGGASDPVWIGGGVVVGVAVFAGVNYTAYRLPVPP